MRCSESQVTSLSYAAPVLLVGAGPATRGDFDFTRDTTQATIAVDGGFNALDAWGVTPDAVLGDMDSIRAEVGQETKISRVSEQDSTDLEKALRLVDAPLHIGIGFLDGRLDHTLAAMHALVAAPHRRAILVGSEDVVFAAPDNWQINLPPQTRISFYPVSRVAGLKSSGLRWPLDGLVLEGGKQIGVSNEASAAKITAQFSERCVVIILPRDFLQNAIDSLK